jgi:hypothetical protein
MGNSKASVFDLGESIPKLRGFEAKRHPRANSLGIERTKEKLGIYNSELVGNMPCYGMMSSPRAMLSRGDEMTMLPIHPFASLSDDGGHFLVHSSFDSLFLVSWPEDRSMVQTAMSG